MSLEVMNTLTVAELESVVDAINKLQAHYMKKSHFAYCPPCEVSSYLRQVHGSLTSCYYCPWVWFAGDTCFATCGVGVTKQRIDRPQWWCDKRLSELAEWERIIRTRIEELKEGRTE